MAIINRAGIWDVEVIETKKNVGINNYQLTVTNSDGSAWDSSVASGIYWKAYKLRSKEVEVLSLSDQASPPTISESGGVITANNSDSDMNFAVGDYYSELYYIDSDGDKEVLAEITIKHR